MIAAVVFVALTVLIAGLPLAHWSSSPWKRPHAAPGTPGPADRLNGPHTAVQRPRRHR